MAASDPEPTADRDPAPVAPTAPPARPERRRGGSVVWPILLILVGGAFLLQNLGILPWEIWPALLRLWPLLLILLGIEMLLGGRLTGGIGRLVLVLLFLVLVGVVALAGWMWAGAGAGGAVETHALDQRLEGAREASVQLEFGAGRLEVGSLAGDGDRLAAVTYEGAGAHRPRASYRVQDGRGSLDFGIRSERGWWWFPFPFVGDRSGRRMEVLLSPDVPLALDFDAGASETRLDLSGLRVTRVDLDAGASRVWLRLPDPRTGVAAEETTARISAGAAALEIEVPEGVALQLAYEGGISSVEVNESRFPRVGGDADHADRRGGPSGDFLGADRVYRSPDYDTARHRVDLEIEAGASSVAVR